MSSPPVATAIRAPRTSPLSANVERLRAMLKQTLRVSIADGRVFLGTFAGTDRLLNILLINTDEFRVGPDAGADSQDGRYVGQVMIPWRLVVRVESREGGGGDQMRYPDSDDDSMFT